MSLSCIVIWTKCYSHIVSGSVYTEDFHSQNLYQIYGSITTIIILSIFYWSMTCKQNKVYERQKQLLLVFSSLSSVGLPSIVFIILLSNIFRICILILGCEFQVRWKRKGCFEIIGKILLTCYSFLLCLLWKCQK